MTVSTKTRRQQFTLDGTEDEFTFTFRALYDSPGDIKCIATDSSSNDTVLAYTTDYSVAVNTNGVGGVVTLVDPAGVGTGTLTVYRETTNTQESDYDDYNQFPADTLEQDLDIRTMVSQEISETQDRTVLLPITTPAGVSADLPTPSSDKVLGWNSAATALENKTFTPATSLQKATVADAQTGTEDTKYMTPSKVKSWTDTLMSTSTGHDHDGTDSKLIPLTSITPTGSSLQILRMKSDVTTPEWAGSGTPSSSNYLRGDMAWTNPLTDSAFAISKVVDGSITTTNSFTICTLTAGVKYRILFSFTQNTADSKQCLFCNADTGANCGWAYEYATGAGQSYGGSVSDKSFGLTSGRSIKATKNWWGEIVAMPLHSSNNTLLITAAMGCHDSATDTIIKFNVSGQYAGAAPVTYFTITGNAGTLTGAWTIYRMS